MKNIAFATYGEHGRTTGLHHVLADSRCLDPDEIAALLRLAANELDTMRCLVRDVVVDFPNGYVGIYYELPVEPQP